LIGIPVRHRAGVAAHRDKKIRQAVFFLFSKKISNGDIMLKKLIEKYGKDKINTLTKYPSILTLHELGEKGVLLDELTTQVRGEKLYATEKIDGTNARLIFMGDEYLIGAREFILHHSDDLYYDQTQGIVDGLKSIGFTSPPASSDLTVVYGEFFGGKSSANSKWYGREKCGFRVFDIAVYKDLSILNSDLPEISLWRERRTERGMIYGQPFLSIGEAREMFPMFSYAPAVQFDLGDYSHKEVLNGLRRCIPRSLVALTETATGNSEGMVLRTWDRYKVVKVRFEDYERTLRRKQVK
jgi:hypothetical protein